MSICKALGPAVCLSDKNRIRVPSGWKTPDLSLNSPPVTGIALDGLFVSASQSVERGREVDR